MIKKSQYVIPFRDLDLGDVAVVGGKNASLGEMIGALSGRGIRVPDGFATTAAAYWAFIDGASIRDDIRALIEAYRNARSPLAETGLAIRDLILASEIPPAIASEIAGGYRALSSALGISDADVAVRSSATAEDLPQASFAGQQETYLNVRGERELLEACKKCMASLFTDRAISYREAHGFDHMQVALSVGVQKMVRSDLAGAGVMFTLDTETGFPDIVLINAAWGLGETVVKGIVDPDEYMVFEPLLASAKHMPIIEKEQGANEQKLVYSNVGNELSTELVPTTEQERSRFVLEDAEIVQLARWARDIEAHYGREMDIEWARDGEAGDLFILQARPETVESRREATSIKNYSLTSKGAVLLSGLAIGSAVSAGTVQVIRHSDDIAHFEPGSILVTEMTDPDWVPALRRAAGIITDHGGRTCHAAIVSRELGIPAIVGTGNATEKLHSGQQVTISCLGDEGTIYDGILEYEESEEHLDNLPETRTKIMINIASPAASLRWWRLPSKGIGLARMEFIVNNHIKIHPMALIHPERVTGAEAIEQISQLTRAYPDKREYFVERLALGIAKIAAPHYPHPVIVRMSDFKTNEYADLIGGRGFEPEESNPMLGFRGASRYYDDRYREGFALECAAIRRVREHIGLENIIVMIPFCRTLEEADRVLEVMRDHGLERGEDGLQVYVMAEIPSNIVLAREFAERFDGFSIGSNDLTQLVLGIDRDSSDLAHLFDERNDAVKRMIVELVEKAHESGTPVGICGEAPSNYPEFAEFLVGIGIDSISLSPDSVISGIHVVASAERNA